MSYFEIVKPQLIIDEGKKRFPYRDTEGLLSVGVGRNLEHKGLREDEIDLMLVNDIQEAEDAARALVPNFDSLSDGRKAVVVNMAFNLGQTRLAEFTRTLAAIRDERFDHAATEMLNSKWARQVGDRALRLSAKMRAG